MKFRSDILYKDLRKGEVYKTSCSTIKAKEKIKFQARVGLKQGLERTWKWFIEN